MTNIIQIKTPTKSGHSCDIFLNESPTKLINKVTPSKTLTPSKDFKPSDNKKTPTKDNIQTKSNEGKSETNGLNSQIPSLFVNNNNSSTNTKDPFNSKPNLFANILKSSLPNSGSIFGANPPPTGGLFSGLFDKKLPSEGGLFGSIPTSGGIFGNSTPINSMFGHPEGRSKLSLEKLTSKDSGYNFLGENIKIS